MEKVPFRFFQQKQNNKIEGIKFNDITLLFNIIKYKEIYKKKLHCKYYLSINL